MTEGKKKHRDTRISAYPHTLEEVLEKALQVPPPDGKKKRGKGNSDDDGQNGEEQAVAQTDESS
jgi:hypothetical protein